MTGEAVLLTAAVGRYSHTEAVLSGALTSAKLRLQPVHYPVITRAFVPMVREQSFDVAEMAIATFLQAKAYAKPLVLLPVVMAARFQEAALLCRIDSTLAGPHDLAGRRVGLRSYSETTGMWLRGLLSDQYGIRPDHVRWVTFDDSPVTDYRDPCWTERAPPGTGLLGMLQNGDLDAIIVGNDMPDDPRLRTVFPSPAQAAEAFWQRHHLVPVNHLLAVRGSLAQDRPDLLVELVRLFREARTGIPVPADPRRLFPASRAALAPALQLAIRYANEQGLLPRPLTLDEVWEGLPPEVT